ncbi:MAG: hypothetical protein HY804_08285 [Nitrospinae bacterium]|nr:hypothetical protein [Nitrospinota bacterium]
MSPKTLAENLGAGYYDLVNIFYDEARRISPDEAQARSLTSEAVAQFLDHYSKIKRGPGPHGNAA